MKIDSAHIEKAISDLKKIPAFSDLREVTPRFLDLSVKYLELLILWNRTHDLVGPPKSVEEFLLTHFVDSLASFHICNKDRPVGKLRYMDIGTGAGIPGFFWHFLYLDSGFEVETILLEPREKRVHFMDEVISQLGLKNVRTLKERVDALPKQNLEFVDVYTARAIKLTDKDLKVLKRIDPSRETQILWLAGPETEVSKDWMLLDEYCLGIDGEHGRKVFFSGK